jgi:SAM-dependent methyltransferase
LIAEWIPSVCPGRVLKTDLFDEAAGRGLVPALSSSSPVHAVDLSPTVAAEAARNNPGGRFVASDIRQLPYRDGCFELVISNSTLDHFESHAALEQAVVEIYRVLAPGGRLLISMDNLANPVLSLRSALPFALLNRVGLVPYFVGVSVTPAGLRQLLTQSGFTVERADTLMHVPRVVAIPLCGWIERSFGPAGTERCLRWMLAFERLRRWPLRNWSAHYVTALAVKPLTRPSGRDTDARPDRR